MNRQNDDRWLDQEAGPIVRPYAMTGGRTRPRNDAELDLMAIVEATGRVAYDRLRLGPEHFELLELCRRPMSVVDVASGVRFPLGVVRVLLGDLRDEGMIVLTAPLRRELMSREGVLREVLSGLRAL
ncbi:DUF742 domain-containing protein [Actinomadura craniellae]|uniref:DUF742 domain-containing protein n=1 Tax=Actinomadura craniellae TaxID=2231787 RepID=A0A365H2W8_9ACTN|nr:DUF742 domain-containing protein [Actinomadura craniellae]RAY13450.1 DUF742 domain-containing protein [Actinomadura craniellae]